MKLPHSFLGYKTQTSDAKTILSKRAELYIACFFGLVTPVSNAAQLDLSNVPLYVGSDAPPMVMMVMGRDHSLFYEAYNDASDLTGDGLPNTNYLPNKVNYYGYFDSNRCYSYSNGLFLPQQAVNNPGIADPGSTSEVAHKTCSVGIGNSQEGGSWSGDFLNYLTMTRMDILRAVLYGGYRSTDTPTETILERAFVPRDAHSWGKSYRNLETNGYDLSQYSSLSLPKSNKQHFFGTATFTKDSVPALRVRKDQSLLTSDNEENGIWVWASSERPVLNGNNYEEYNVRVKVCLSESVKEENCKKYAGEDNLIGSYKPTGLLHDYGENGSILFGLLSGSYDNNLTGGVLRKVISNFSDEVDPNTGQFPFKDTSNKDPLLGIVSTIDKLNIHGFEYGNYNNQGNHTYGACGWQVKRAIRNGECPSWGNPIGEMLYESLRYFAGAKSPTAAFNSKPSIIDEGLKLPSPKWDNPFEPDGLPARPYCSAPHSLIISGDPSYDSDLLPGSSFGNPFSDSTFSSFSIQNLLSTISKDENIDGGRYFIGESVGVDGEDGAENAKTVGSPTAKKVKSLASVRGLSPLEPTKEGSYSVAAAAYFGHKLDLFPGEDKQVNVKTTVVAMASQIPDITVKIPSSDTGEEQDQYITIVPFAKTVGGEAYGNRVLEAGPFFPTNTLVDLYVQEINDSKGTFRINFEDVEQGADHEMDMIVQYDYSVEKLCPFPGDSCTSKRWGVKVSVDSVYASGSLTQHAGYVISGAVDGYGNNVDGIYLDVRDQPNHNEGYAYNYLDTPLLTDRPYPNNVRKDEEDAGKKDDRATLEFQRTRHFFPSNEPAKVIPSPLWYAAKWGGFNDKLPPVGTGKPDAVGKWDSTGSGHPDTFFPVTNAGQLGEQLGQALANISAGEQSGTPLVFNNNFLNISGTFLYQSSFDGQYWSGDVKAFEAKSGGDFSPKAEWSAANSIDSTHFLDREIFTVNSEFSTLGMNIVDFIAPSSLNPNKDSISGELIDALLKGNINANGEKVLPDLEYLTSVINYLRGDRTNETLEGDLQMRKRGSALGDIVNSTPYYVAEATGHEVAVPVLVFGANDGMVHVINGKTGKELMAYIPSQVHGHLNSLPMLSYTHKYFVDGAISGYTDKSASKPITTVVGSLGTGVKGLYALDVSNMNQLNKKSTIKWEISADGSYSNLGYSQAAPTIAKLSVKSGKDNRVGVIFSGGYNSPDGIAKLFIADLKDGSHIRTLSTGVGASADPTGKNRPNALGEPAVIDITGDGVADRIYAGDLFGNMWVFDISEDSSLNWGVATQGKKPLFTAESPSRGNAPVNFASQAITSQPSVGRHPNGHPQQSGVLVAFGTGKYIENQDKATDNQDTQSVYVIWDKNDNQAIGGRNYNGEYSELQAQKIIEEDTQNRQLTENQVDWNLKKGWYLDLVNTQNNNSDNKGERQVTNSLLIGNKLSFTTLIPNDDSCSSGGSGWYMEVDLRSGVTWNKGTDGNTDPDNGNTINDDSSHQKIEGGIPSAPIGIIDPGFDDDGLPSKDGIVQKNCISLSNGKTICYDDPQVPTGRLSLRRLH
ncbi:pilus assembly protein [Agarivorans albus]|nr:PilC/PilY family type IV pilus protein [Agarivorans albus]